MLRCATALLLLMWISACTTVSDVQRPLGEQICESFFIYVVCIADLDRNGRVDYMYFDDTRDIFMYDESMREQLATVLPLHPCAIPMSASTKDTSSALLYGKELPVTKRLGLKARLLRNYQVAQPAVDACYASLDGSDSTPKDDEPPFITDDDWDKGLE